jgi:hypothetical protein
VKFQSSLAIFAVSLAAILVGCGSSSNNNSNQNPISVALSSPPTSLQTNATATLTAIVSNDSANAGVTWSCAPAGSCGSFNPASSAGSNATTTYTAPSAGGNVTIAATSVTDSTKAAQTTVTITAPAGISVSLSPAPPTSLQISTTTTLTAVVASDSTNAGVTWSCAPTGGCGSFNPTTSAGSSATTTYTAPAAVPAGNAVTVIATSITDPTKSAQAAITITTTAPTLGDGTYVFSLAGQDQFAFTGVNCGAVADVECAPYFVAGAFTVTGGTIAGGEQDFIDLSTIATDTFTGGSVTQTGDGTGNLLITLSFTRNGVPLTETLSGTLVSAVRALITEFDSSATSSGSLNLQESTITAPSGGYAFVVSGLDGNTGGPSPVNIGGVINVDGSPISGNGSVFDINDAGTVSQNQSFANTSTVSAPDQFGRVQFNLVPSSSSLQPFNLVGYVVGAGHIRLVETSETLPSSLNGTTGGVALGQGSNTGTFSMSSIAGSSFVISTSGADTSGAFQVAGVLTTNSDGTVTGTLNANDLVGTGVQAPIPFTGTYTVDPTGRVTLSSLTGGPFTFTAQMYLSGLGTASNVSGNGTATVVSMDASDVLAGVAYQQTGGGSFTAASFSGNYGMNATGFDFNNELEFDAVGPVSADGVSMLNGTVDLNFMVPPGTQATVSINPAAFASDPSGVFTGTMTGLDIDNPGNNDAFSYYLVDTTKVIAIETDSNQLTLIFFQLQQ